MLTCPLSNKAKKRNTRVQQLLVEDYEQPKHDPMTFVLSAEELRRHKYPNANEVDSTYCCTTTLARARRVFALDCEMCKTSKGLELTRVTLVNSKREVVYDEFVKPPHEIINYLTEYVAPVIF